MSVSGLSEPVVAGLAAAVLAWLVATGDAAYWELQGSFSVAEAAAAASSSSSSSSSSDSDIGSDSAASPYANVAFLPEVGYAQDAADWKVVVFAASAMTVARFVLMRAVFAPLGRAVGGIRGGDDNKASAAEMAADAAKWGEAAWLACYYAVILVFEWGWVVPEGWVLSPEAWWVGAPDGHAMSWATKQFYLVGMIAFWLHGLVTLMLEEKKKDFKEMLSHHLLTIGMCIISYRIGFFRIGAAIMIEQDIADAFLYNAKLFNYAGNNGNKLADQISTVLFATFAASWAVTRHGIFAFIYHSIYTQFPIHITNIGTGPGQVHPYIYPGFLIALALFQGLMIFWFYLIMRMVIKVAFGGEDLRDSREKGAKKAAAKKHAAASSAAGSPTSDKKKK